MPLNIAVGLVAGVAFLIGGLVSPIAAQAPCSAATDSALLSGWRAYRADSLPAAFSRFELAHRLCPQNLDAMVGQGFTLMRSGQVRRADTVFGEVLAQNPAHADAWEGRTRASLRLGDTARAVSAGRRALALNANNSDLRALLDRAAPGWNQAPSRKPSRRSTLQLVSRTRGTGFEVRTGKGWRPFYLKGVNLGVALPGRFPSQFPNDPLLYAGWLDTLASMHANTLRVYTILPPSFYHALRAWNLTHPDRLLWLVHGVWAELPPRHDFADPDWERDFLTEARRVVDLVHGTASVPPRPGHAAGRYDADVSPWVLGYIIGREWEPFAVKEFNARGPARQGYEGRYLRIRQGTAMDTWLARQCDAVLAYEVDVYNALRPIAYTNWPTLDPLTHATEANTAEEARWRRNSGRLSEAKKLEYENDAVGLDANLIEPTGANVAGWFASYHAYPYYPDFIMLDPGYRSAQSSEGRSSYFGYLRELVRHHGAIPTVISEYGVPSSRGVAHLHPQGWGHGGHDERAMAAIDARLTREIREAGAAGAILFAWLDEWFKKNWAVIDYEIPPDNTRLWHNTMDPEQNYGIMGQYAGKAGESLRLGGPPERWRRHKVLQRANSAGIEGPRLLRAAADESFCYLSVELPPGRFPWESLGIQLAIDTYMPTVGQHRLPVTGVRSEAGFEFLVDLVSPTRATLKVIPDYNRYESRIDSAGDDLGRFSRRPALTRDRTDARFDSLFVITNRARFGRKGDFFPAKGYDRGRLLYGTEDASTLSDWYLDERAGLLELRIPWDLLNVTDPSTRTLLHDPKTTGDVGTVAASDFRVGVVIYRKGAQPTVAGSLPELRDGAWQMKRFVPWQWQGWTEPRSHSRLKPVFDSLRLLWREAEKAGASPAPARLEQQAPSN